MPLSGSTDIAVFYSKNLFADLSNIVKQPNPIINDRKLSEIDHQKRWSCRHNTKDFYFTYEEAMQKDNEALTHLREKIEKPVLQELCNRVHHSTYSLDDLVESIDSYLEHFYVKGENVEFSPGKDRTVIAKVVAVEKKGGAVFYTIRYDEKEIGRIIGRDLKRRYSITEDDIRSAVLLMGSQQPGKPWQIEEVYKKEYGVKDKLAPIFCSPSMGKPSSKTVSNAKQSIDKSGRESDSDSDAPLSHFVGQRRSGMAIPPSASMKEIDKERIKQEKKHRKDKPKKEKAEKKEEKKEQKENNTWGLHKFICSNFDANGEKKSESASSPFLTPQKRSEKRFNSAIHKLQDAWRKRDEQEFIAAAAWSAKVLSSVQIDRISNECHRFAVRKAYNKVKDAEALKKIRSKEARKEFRDKIHEERHEQQKIMLAKIKTYFSQEVAEEDLRVCDEPLPCPGIVSVSSGQSALFTECLVFTQFFSSLKKFIEADHNISARELFDAVHDGRIGFVKCTSKLLGSLLKTLLQDPEHGRLAHFNVRLQEFAVEDNTVSELCRALLMGSMEKGEEKVCNAEQSTEETENGRESECGTPCDFNNISQIDIDVCQTFLDRFSSEKELWELSPEDQLGILGLVLNRVLELRSFKEYISQEGLSETARNLRDKIKKYTEQVTSLQDELSSIPEIKEVDYPSLLSRSQTRERVERQRQRETLEKKIEEIKDKLEDLLEKLAHEKLARSHSKRILPIGEDRHFRRYFWFNGKSADDGIWIQDMGTCAYEQFIRSCIRAGKSFELDVDESIQNSVPACDELNGNGASSPEGNHDFDSDANPIDEFPVSEPRSSTEVWYKLPDAKSLEDLINSLNKVGIREGRLKAFLVKKKEAILSCISSASSVQLKTPNNIEDMSEDEDLCPESMLSLKKSIVQLASDLRCSYLTNIGSVDAFEAEVLRCTTLDEIKEKLCILADSITPSAIVRRQDFKVALQTGQHSVMVLERWKHCLAECQNASGVHLLRSYLDSRINWKNSVVEKRCNSCGSRRSPESKISCANCAVVTHYYCTRPRLLEKPTSWLCPTCTRLEKKKEEVFSERTSLGKANNRPVNDLNSSDDESVEDLSSVPESENEDFFTDKLRRSNRKRTMEDYFVDDVGDKRTRTKRAKSNAVTEECMELLNRVKSSSRLYRTLQNIPPGRITRRSMPSSIDGLEEAITGYDTLGSFASDLNHFLKYARSYLEEHNERKLEELETVLSDLKLESLTNC